MIYLVEILYGKNGRGIWGHAGEWRTEVEANRQADSLRGKWEVRVRVVSR